MSLPLLETAEIPVSEFCRFVDLDEDRLRGLVSVRTARLDGSTAPVWLLRYTLEDFAGLDGVRSAILIPDAIMRSAPARQASFLFGRMAARAGIRYQLSRDAAVVIGLLGAPVWPDGLYGSISHTDTHALSWVESGPNYIGIDLEQEVSTEDARNLSDQVMSMNEANLLSSAFGSADWACAVTLLFSAKEAAYKALCPFVRRYMDFHEMQLVAIDLPGGSLSLRKVPRIGGKAEKPARVDVHFASLDGSILTHAAVNPSLIL